MIVEDSWGMLNWLHQYVADNKHEWERRREREKLESNKEYDIWKGMDEMEMIEIIKEQEKKETAEEENKTDKAERKRGYWKTWRKDKEVDPAEEENKEMEKGVEAEEEPAADKTAKRRKMTRIMKEKRADWQKEKKVIYEEGLKKGERNLYEEPLLDPQIQTYLHKNEDEGGEGVKKDETGIELRLCEEPPLDPLEQPEPYIIEEE